MNRIPTPKHVASYSDATAFSSGVTQQPFQSFDALGLLSILRINLKVIAAITALCVVGMYIYLLTLPPTYTAYSQVILDTREERAAPVQEVVSNLTVTNSVIAGEIVTIRSNSLVGQIVDNLQLVDHPAFDPRLPRGESLFSAAKRLLRGGQKPHEFAAQLPEETLRSWVIQDVRRKLSVSQIGVSYAIGISFEGNDPKLVSDIANAVANNYIDSQLETKMQATLRANSWLGDRLTELSRQVEDADAAVVDFQERMIDTAGGSEDSINQLLAELNTKLVGSSTDRADAEVRLRQVEGLEADGGLQSLGDVLTSPLLEALNRQRAELEASRARMASTLGRRHPDMIRISAQITDIDRSIGTELRRRVEEMKSEVSVTRNREEALREQIEAVSLRAESLSKDSVRLGQLERAAEATRLVYENFLARYKETSAQSDFQTPEARVIGVAAVPTVPSGPRKTMFMVAAAVIGFSGAIALVFLRNLIRAPITTGDELRAVTGLPTVAVLPFVGRIFGNKNWLMNELTEGVGSSYLERVRAIQTHLFDASDDRPPKVILVTSSVPNEGKTSLCCMLAKVLGQRKKSVLLFDADLRRPDVRSALQMDSDNNCLISYLEKDTNYRDLAVRSDLLQADVISPSRPTENAANLLASQYFSGLFGRLSSKYDVIVVNAPPVLHLSDSILLEKLADATLLAVKYNATPTKVIKESLRRLRKSEEESLVGTVLTMVRHSSSRVGDLDTYRHHY